MTFDQLFSPYCRFDNLPRTTKQDYSPSMSFSTLQQPRMITDLLTTSSRNLVRILKTVLRTPEPCCLISSEHLDGLLTHAVSVPNTLSNSLLLLGNHLRLPERQDYVATVVLQPRIYLPAGLEPARLGGLLQDPETKFC